MAQPQAYHPAYQQQQANKGTLVAGQTISVNKYTVQVERYLSQGGFAHVYLVRTAQPVYGTTHHVLKRIAVPNETMLTEVKKEVDIMRILKGHPNIVHLIDAAWHRMSNGTYEVFILMEYCPGGGIIDMMNRRLRERLTEMEILTIFVDVCEGLAAMHTLKPPLLHRDLKVENILQSSPSSYKLCDFGSATPVQRVPNNMAELRALEADLNRHTTLQYRAPEMVDVFLRRPIDEKSDVWALGVLLYKLCYYTTPFEEHGPLAILNVQYKIPPYPVYSQHMNSLIGSMLREHGAQRPTVFEILNHVHTLRGTRSRFTYNVPSKPQAPVAPLPVAPLQTLSPNLLSPAGAITGVHAYTNPLDDLVMFKSRSAQAITSPTASAPAPSAGAGARNHGVEAREKVLEAIAPMRRGRPTPVSSSSSSDAAPTPESPTKRGFVPKEQAAFSFDAKSTFEAEEEKAWRGLGLKGHKSGMASFGSSGAHLGAGPGRGDDAWGLGGKAKETDDGKNLRTTAQGGFENDFSASSSLAPGAGFGDSFQPSPSRSPLAQSKALPSSQPTQPIVISRPSPSPGHSDSSKPQARSYKERDAFEGLGLPGSSQPPRTLGEAQRERSRSQLGMLSSTPGTASLGVGSATTTVSYTSSSRSPVPGQRARRSSRSPSKRPAIAPEDRFPSLEELDRAFETGHGESADKLSVSSAAKIVHAPTQPALTERAPSRTNTGAGISALNSASAGSGQGLLAAPGGRFDGVRSQHVTGTAMRESRSKQAPAWDTKPSPSPLQAQPSRESPLRPQPRRHRSSISIKARPAPSPGSSMLLSPPTASATTTPTSFATSSSESERPSPALPPRPTQQRDWLTGTSDDEVRVPSRDTGREHKRESAFLRDSPRKRASYIEKSPVRLAMPLEAESGTMEADILGLNAADLERDREREREERERERREKEREHEQELRRLKEERLAQERERAQQRERELQAEREREDQARRERERLREQREQEAAARKARAYVSRSTTGPGGYQLPSLAKPTPMSLSSSVSGLTGLTESWSPVSPSPPTALQRDVTSSSDEGPEDVDGFKARSSFQQAGADLDRTQTTDSSLDRNSGRGRSPDKSRERRTHSGRQGSVHELAGFWQGSTASTSPMLPTKLADKRRSAIVSSSSMRAMNRSIPSSSLSQSVTASAQSPVAVSHSTGRALPRPPSRQQRTETPADASSADVGTAPATQQEPERTSIPVTRARPQSMFINPVSRTAPLESALSNTSSIPEEPTKLHRSNTRRTSISDMVQRYEAFNGKPSAAPPAVAAKPPALSVKTLSSDTASSGVPSPSTAATRFPKLSPANSPILTKASLALPEDPRPAPGRSSPAPRMTSTLTRAPTVSTRTSEQFTGSSVTSVPARKAPAAVAKVSEAAQVRAEEKPPPLERRRTESPEQVRAPSPEKPFGGVSSLINRWQRAVDDESTVPNRGLVAKKPGVANTSLRGR